MQEIRLTSMFPYDVSRDVIYIESDANVRCNCYIVEHYDEIAFLCKARGCRFVYLPKVLPALMGNAERMKYNLPWSDNRMSSRDIEVKIRQIYDFYCNYIRVYSDAELLQPMFVFTSSQYRWYACGVDEDISEFLKECDRVGECDEVRFRITPPRKPDDCSQADWDFSDEVDRLKQEISERIKKLRTYGVEEVAIRELFAYKPQLSRLVITDDYRILLPDYGIEMKMVPLIKAVYLLFLRHEEGILFKNLVDYRSELLLIYNHITRFEDLERIERSIDLLVNPTNNSINEKCSRIREAFVSQINDDIAKSYYITGGRLEKKRIVLNRELVVWECGL